MTSRTVAKRTAAERMARLRQRQKAGLVAVTIGKQRYEVTEETAKRLSKIVEKDTGKCR